MAKTQEPEKLQEPEKSQTDDMAKETEAYKSSPKYFRIEELKEKKQTPAAFHCGTCAANKWGPGKMVTEAEYDTAVDTFKTAPMGRRIK